MPGISAVVLAGDRKGAKAIRHENKAFLSYRGEPLLVHVLRALQQAQSISSIVIVGPKKRLQKMLASSSLGDAEGLQVVEQRQNLLENGKAGFVHSLGKEYSPSLFHDLRHTEHADTQALFVSCDIPLVTSWEVDELVTKSDLTKYDYSIGLTKESVMEHYYPADGQPGIKMAYFHLAEGRCRQNNMHVVKPLKVHRLIFIEQMYLTRYQKKLRNIFRLFLSLLFVGRWTFRAAQVYIGLQFAAWLYRRQGGGRLYERVRAANTLRLVTRCIGGIMDMKLQGIFTTYGGAVLDVDNAKDLEVAEAMHETWMEHQRQIHQRSK